MGFLEKKNLMLWRMLMSNALNGFTENNYVFSGDFGVSYKNNV